LTIAGDWRLTVEPRCGLWRWAVALADDGEAWTTEYTGLAKSVEEAQSLALRAVGEDEEE
jgi:hypothetical protein